MTSQITLRLECDSGVLKWSLANPPISAEPLVIDVDLDALQRQLSLKWTGVISAASSREFDAARQLLIQLRSQLARDLVPEQLDLANLANENALIAVELFPDWLPLQLLPAGNKPFGVRYRTLHMKRLRSDALRLQTVSHSLEPPAAQFTMMHNLLLRSPEQHQQHFSNIRGILQRIYGRSQLLAIHNSVESKNLRRDDLADALCNPNLDCLYHLGHGYSNAKGVGLEAADGPLDVESLRTRLQHARLNGGFAFINACRSGAAEGAGFSDIAQLLIEHGRHAVLGSVLSPLDAHAALFAESIFEKLASTKTISRAFHTSIVDSWRRFEKFLTSPGTSREAFDLSWACYRLYGSPATDSLRTPSYEPSGCQLAWIKECQKIVLANLGSSDAEKLACLHRDCDIKIAESFDDFMQHDAFRTLLPEFLESALGCLSVELLNDVLDAFAKHDHLKEHWPDFIEAASRYFPPDEVELMMAGNRTRTPILRYRSSQEVTVLRQQIAPQSSSHQVQHEDGRSTIRRENVNAVEQAARYTILGQPAIRRVLSLSWRLALDSESPKLSQTHLIKAAIVEALTSLPVNHSDDGLLLAMRDISEDVWSVLERINTSEPTGPQIIQILHSKHPLPFAEGAREALDSQVVAWIGQRRCLLLPATETADKCSGRLVGLSAGTIPQIAKDKWQNNVKEIISALGSKEPKAIVIDVPWEPALGSALVDVFAAHIQSRVRLRPWIHLTGAGLLRRQFSTSSLQRLFRRAYIVSDLADKVVLVVSQVQRDHLPSIKEILSGKTRLPKLLLLSHQMPEASDSILGSDCKVVELNGMSTVGELRQFLLEWDAARHPINHTPEYDEAITLLVDQVWTIWRCDVISKTRSQDAMLGKSVEVLEAARETARANNTVLKPEYIEQVIDTQIWPIHSSPQFRVHESR